MAKPLRVEKPVAALPESIRSESDALQRPQIAAAYEVVGKQLDELADLLANALHAPSSAHASIVTDARMRVAQLRHTLGL